jgi:hypothetical protein
LKTPDGRSLRFAVSDPTDWNEAADMGAFEIVDAVVVSDSRAAELDLTVWRALGGGVVREPRRELDQNRDPSARFPTIDPLAARFTSDAAWIPQKRDTTQLFVVIYGFAFFVVVFATWTRKGGPWLLMSSAVVVAALFVAAFSAFYPKGNLAVKYWQGVVDAPEEKVAISISALWGSGPAEEVRFGRVVKHRRGPVDRPGREAGGPDPVRLGGPAPLPGSAPARGQLQPGRVAVLPARGPQGHHPIAGPEDVAASADRRGGPHRRNPGARVPYRSGGPLRSNQFQVSCSQFVSSGEFQARFLKRDRAMLSVEARMNPLPTRGVSHDWSALG